MCRKRNLVLVTCLGLLARAQGPLSSRETRRADEAFENAKRTELSCYVEPAKPFVDFAFRFEVGYVVHCPLREFEGKATKLVSYLRVRPAGEMPTILGEGYRLPAMPPDGRFRIDMRRLNTEIEFSGVFAVGEGEYPVELVVADDHNRYCERHWSVKAFRRGGDQAIPISMKPNSAAAITVPQFEREISPDRRGGRVTVLLDAAPINPSAVSLRAWDRAFLLDSLSSLLRKLPCDSVRLVAFNLEQQREVFRRDRFDGSAFQELSDSLEDLELGTISYRVLERQQGWWRLLAGLSNEEARAETPPDAVVFLGPRTRIARKIPEEILKAAKGSGPQFFYIEYFSTWGEDFPDAIDYLTSARDGTSFKIHSPGELAQAIRKIQEQLRHGRGAISVE